MQSVTIDVIGKTISMKSILLFRFWYVTPEKLGNWFVRLLPFLSMKKEEEEDKIIINEQKVEERKKKKTEKKEGVQRWPRAEQA